MSEQIPPPPKKVVSRNVAIAIGIICIILIALIAYFTITGISAQNSYNNLQNENKQLQTWLNGNETLLSQTQANNTNLQNQMNDLMSILSLDKSTVWYNGTLQIVPSEMGTMLAENAPYAGFVSVHASSPPTNETVVELIFYSESLDIRHDETVNVGSDGTAIFPVLPSSMGIYFSDPNLLGSGILRTANVTIAYYY
jgi:archaellum component FlaF (FlaF/FlaG flagellin family)